ncbi:MAG TPA: exopolyphosphatase [Bacteroidales bacterium]|nr:exopolyphosphatase [Bacteroidales bacterium]
MMNILKFAAIDIGSNAARLLLTNVIEDGLSVVFRKSLLVRMPLRLGEDAFSIGYISQPRAQKLLKIMIAYKNLMEVEEVVAFRVCATSAMRESSNASELVDMVREKTGIQIEVIDGKKEAEIIYANGIVETLNGTSPYIYVDVGGGSTEITLFDQGKIQTSFSFDIGTIRMLKGKVDKSNFEEIKQWIKSLNIKKQKPKIIGSGGNINKLYKLAMKTNGEVLTYDEIKELYKFIGYYSVEERIKSLGLNPDRADVIIPATKIYLKVMKWSGANEVIVPTIGISDGIVRTLYYEYKNQLTMKQ